MKRVLLVFTVLLFTLACGFSALQQTQSAPATRITVPTAAISAPPAAPTTAATLYISATMHIESKPDSWPQNADTFLAFLQQSTATGLRWSIGGDVGWLESAPDAQEIVQRSAALGVQWDVHAHKKEDLAKVASILSGWGITPTGVVSGMLIKDLDALRQPLTYQSYTWTPQVVWGGVNCPGHRPGCDDTSIALYRPTSSAAFDVHDPNANLIKVGGGDHTLAGANSLIEKIQANQVTAPVVGFTLMVEPETLRIIQSATDDLNAIMLFTESSKQKTFVRFGTIAETAQAWVGAGSIAIQIP
jgi:hypothetical protein